jgi:hypothetical protein
MDFSVLTDRGEQKAKVKTAVATAGAKSEKTYNECEHHQFVGTHSPSAPPLEPG